MKERAKARMKTRRAKYLVGYIGAGNFIYSHAYPHPQCLNDPGSMLPMTLKKARVLLETMPCADCAIFELVPIEVNR